MVFILISYKLNKQKLELKLQINPSKQIAYWDIIELVAEAGFEPTTFGL